MYLSAKSQYACLAMLQLAVDFPSGEPVQIRSIAERHGIPQRFLVQILLQLKRAGLVTSTRGSQGGYRLGQSPQEISLAEVLNAIDGSEPLSLATTKSPFGPTLMTWCDEMSVVLHERLAQTSLATFLDRANRSEEPMWYI
jgi:Rrf2 family protein